MLKKLNCNLNEENLNCCLSWTIQTKMNNRYTDAVSAKYQDLVCMGFGTDNLGAVIKPVFNNLANLKGDCLPSLRFLV